MLWQSIWNIWGCFKIWILSCLHWKRMAWIIPGHPYLETSTYVLLGWAGTTWINWNPFFWSVWIHFSDPCDTMAAISAVQQSSTHDIMWMWLCDIFGYIIHCGSFGAVLIYSFWHHLIKKNIFRHILTYYLTLRCPLSCWTFNLCGSMVSGQRRGTSNLKLVPVEFVFFFPRRHFGQMLGQQWAPVGRFFWCICESDQIWTVSLPMVSPSMFILFIHYH